MPAFTRYGSKLSPCSATHERSSPKAEPVKHQNDPVPDSNVANVAKALSRTSFQEESKINSISPRSEKKLQAAQNVMDQKTLDSPNGSKVTTDRPILEKRKKSCFIVQNYKTEICRSHRQTGLCEYEGSCQFAHGIHELRPRHYGLKYKTQECKNYHSEGYCRFGSRCKFIHDEHRIRVANDEFWLVSPSENLVRVEVVENPGRQAELTKLFGDEVIADAGAMAYQPTESAVYYPAMDSNMVTGVVNGPVISESMAAYPASFLPAYQDTRITG